LHLYSELEKLQERVIYFDTDSIMFTYIPGQYKPFLGNYLGQFTDEIDKNEGNYIVEFVSAGPKNYAYKLDTGITHCTIKGFTLNYLTSLKINFDTIKDIVCNNQKLKIQSEQSKFIRNKKDWTIKTECENKQYGFVYDKRALFTDLTTLTYVY